MAGPSAMALSDFALAEGEREREDACDSPEDISPCDIVSKGTDLELRRLVHFMRHL
jgi:hypothetical protein